MGCFPFGLFHIMCDLYDNPPHHTDKFLGNRILPATVLVTAARMKHLGSVDGNRLAKFDQARL